MEGLPGDPVRRAGRGGRVGGGVLSEAASRPVRLGSGPEPRRLLLWRHGRTRWNVDGRFQGRLDSPLDPAGLVDVEKAALVLAALSPAVLVTSSAGRASGTAEYLARCSGLRAAPEPDLQELNLGVWQGLTHDEAREKFPDEYAAWLRGEDVRRGGGETYAEVGERASRVLGRVCDGLGAGGLAVIVSHGGTIRAALGAMLGLPLEVWARLAPVGNARWSVLVESRQGWRLAEHNAGVTEPPVSWRNEAPDVEPDADEGLAGSADI